MKKDFPVPQKSAAAATTGRIDPMDWIDETGAGADVARAIHRQLRRRRRRATAATGLAALLLGVFLWSIPWQQSRDTGRPLPASAIVTLPARQLLPDGTVVELKADAAIEPSFTPSLRKIALLHGEAHFQVKHDAARPFVVSVGGVEVRAVGTAFSVEFGKTSVEVLVTEGRVAVQQTVPVSRLTTLAPVDPPAALVDAGSVAVVEIGSASLATPPKVAPVPAVTLKERLAWRVPQLQFSATPLSEVIAMINVHSPVRLILGNEALGRIKISGVLRADNLNTLLELLAESHRIKAEHRSAFEIVLTNGR